MKSSIVSGYFILLLFISTAFGRHVRLQSGIHRSSSSNPKQELKTSTIVEKDSMSKGFLSAKQHISFKGHENRPGKDKMQQMLQTAGSSLPDCSHACGSCKPCRRVTVSFKCSVSTEESESCPMAYRCMCKGKYFPVP